MESLLHATGEWAAYALVAVLWLTPLRLALGRYPSCAWIKRWQTQRRPLGIASAVYASLHLTVHVLDNLEWQILWEDLQRIYLLTGLGAFLLLLPLALTSNNASVRKLGARRWKQMHRLAYVAAVLAAVHLFLNEKSSDVRALILFVPLLGAEILRLGGWLSSKSPRRI